VGRPDGSAPGTVPAVPPIWAVTAAVNAAAAIALATVLAPGVSLTYGPDNAAYVGAHLLLWRAGWALWITAAVSLLAFFVWWAARAGWTGVARVAVAIATVGVVADVTAEARLFAWSADVDVGAALRQSGVVANASTPERAAAISDVEAELVDVARQHTPRELGGVVRYLIDAIDGDGGAVSDEALFERRRLHLSSTLDGMLAINGICDPASAEILLAAVNAEMAQDHQELDGRMPAQRRMDALTNLYPGLSVGGFLIVDDYEHAPCRQAVTDFRDAHGIDEPIEAIDWLGAFWRRAH